MEVLAFGIVLWIFAGWFGVFGEGKSNGAGCIMFLALIIMVGSVVIGFFGLLISMW